MHETTRNPDTRLIDLASSPFHDTALLSFPAFNAIPGFAHAVTTKPWNMAAHRGPDADRAAGRRRAICEHLGFPFEKLTAPDQIHSAHVLRVLPTDVGAGRFGRDDAMRFVDGLVCSFPGVAILQMSADCPLILAVDPVRRAFGTAHASWRGTVARIAIELIRRMVADFNSNPTDLIAAICPCAGPQRYEIGDDVRRIADTLLCGTGFQPVSSSPLPAGVDQGEGRVLYPLPPREGHREGHPVAAGAPAGRITRDGSKTRDYFPLNPNGRTCFDLRRANVDQLLATGIPPAHIFVASACTISDPRFYSHRREGPPTGRFALIAGFVRP